MKKSLQALAIFAMLVSPLYAHADTVSKQRKVGELLVTLHLEEETGRQLRPQEESFRALSQQQMEGATPDPDQKKAFEDFRTQVFSLLRGAGRWSAIRDAYLQLYAETYSEQEVDGMLAFYRPPVGQSVIAKTPELTQRCSLILEKRLDSVKPRIHPLMDAMMLKLQ